MLDLRASQRGSRTLPYTTYSGTALPCGRDIPNVWFLIVSGKRRDEGFTCSAESGAVQDFNMQQPSPFIVSM